MGTVRRVAVGSAPIPARVRCLELDHLRLVDLVHHRAGRPGQPVGARVQAGRQDHHLTHARVPVASSSSRRSTWCAPPSRRPSPAVRAGDAFSISREVELAVHHLDEEIHPDGAHQWLGERIVDQTAGILGRHRAPGRDHGCGRAHAGRQIPVVVVSACHGSSPISIQGRRDVAHFAERGRHLVLGKLKPVARHIAPWRDGRSPASRGRSGSRATTLRSP